jgi:hypothetical protein
MTAHSPLGASGMYRWKKCPGSVRLLEQVPKSPSSVYAHEGSCAHALAEQALRQNKDADYYHYLGLFITPAGTVADPKTLKDPESAIPITDDMVEAVQVYLDAIREDRAAMVHAPLSVEKQFVLGWIDETLFGTNDASLGEPFGLLRVYDYKHGKGVVVEVEENDQLLYYALGAIGADNPQDYQEVEIVIAQPRAFHQEGRVRRWRTTPAAVYQWAEEVLKPAVAATRAPDAPVKAGEWCKFCDAKAVCPAAHSAVNDALQGVFTPAVVPPSLPAPDTLSREQRLAVLRYGDMAKAWIDEVFAFEQRAAEAGDPPPGYKLVRGRSYRKWNDDAENGLRDMLGDDAYERKLVTITAAEKLLKSMGADKNAVAHLTYKPEGKLTLASEEDPRPAVEAGPVFTPVNS